MQGQDQQIKILKRIGKGSYGEVFLCEDSQGHQIALKAIKRNLLDDKFQNSYKCELNALKKLQQKKIQNEENKKENNSQIEVVPHNGLIKRSNSFDQELCFMKEQNSQLHCQDHQFNYKSNIIQYIKNIDNYSFTFNSTFYSCHALFIEYAKNGCLGNYLESPQFVNLPITILRRIAKQLFQGIQEMHDAHLVHRDIKEDNIVFSESFNVKIIDLSFAGRNDNEVCGTQKYISPEILKLEVQMMSDVSPSNAEQKIAQKEKNFQRFTKVDTFAAGVVLFRLITKKFPFSSASRFDHRYKHIVSKQYDQFWKDIKLILTEYDSIQNVIDFNQYLHNYHIEETLHDLETSSNSIDSALIEDIENMDGNQESSDNQSNSESQSNSEKSNQEQEIQRFQEPIVISNADLKVSQRKSRKFLTYIKQKRASSQVNCFLTPNEQQFFNDLMHTSNKSMHTSQQRHSMSEIASFKEQIEHLKDLIQNLLAYDVEERFTVEQALKHNFFTSFEKYEHSKYIASSKDLQSFFSQINQS